MNSLYNISIQLYVIAIRFAALFNAKAKLWVNGKKNIFQKIEEVTKGEQNIVWFHCASLGEFEQGKPIIEGYKQKYPSHKFELLNCIGEHTESIDTMTSIIKKLIIPQK